jgi:hypothetical protein
VDWRPMMSNSCLMVYTPRSATDAGGNAHGSEVGCFDLTPMQVVNWHILAAQTTRGLVDTDCWRTQLTPVVEDVDPFAPLASLVGPVHRHALHPITTA